MKVTLMLTCLCDAFYGEVGIATVRVLEHAGCAVHFPKQQTCCGQPPFNAGDWSAARTAAEHWKSVFGRSAAQPIVTPSSSCAAMIREGYGLLFGNHEVPPVFELSEFLIRELKIDRWPLSYAPPAPGSRRLAFHRACHGRGLGLKDEQVQLLRMVDGLEIVTLDQAEQCCGFGGAFSAVHSAVSAGIGDEKLEHVLETGAKALVSGDMGCLMHLGGLVRRQGLDLQLRHFAEILADAIPAEVPA